MRRDTANRSNQPSSLFDCAAENQRHHCNAISSLAFEMQRIKHRSCRNARKSHGHPTSTSSPVHECISVVLCVVVCCTMLKCIIGFSACSCFSQISKSCLRSERQRARQSTRLSLKTRYVFRSARYEFVAHTGLKFLVRIIAQNRSDRATKTRYESIVAPAGLTVAARRICNANQSQKRVAHVLDLQESRNDGHCDSYTYKHEK